MHVLSVLLWGESAVVLLTKGKWSWLPYDIALYNIMQPLHIKKNKLKYDQ